MKNCCCSILILEDDTDLSDILEYIVNDLGIKVFKTDTAKKALEILNNNKICFGIIDFHLPDSNDSFDLNTNTFIKTLNSMKNFDYIFATGNIMLDQSVAKNLGALDVIHKPFVGEEIQTLLKSYIKLKGRSICLNPDKKCILFN